MIIPSAISPQRYKIYFKLPNFVVVSDIYDSGLHVSNWLNWIYKSIGYRIEFRKSLCRLWLREFCWWIVC